MGLVLKHVHASPHAQVSYVKGIDLSDAEINEAKRRFAEVQGRDRGENYDSAQLAGLGCSLRCCRPANWICMRISSSSHSA